MSITAEHYFFIDSGSQTTISVKGHNYETDGGQKEQNAKIQIEDDKADLELEISLPKKDLKKLIVAAQKFLEVKI